MKRDDYLTPAGKWSFYTFRLLFSYLHNNNEVNCNLLTILEHFRLNQFKYTLHIHMVYLLNIMLTRGYIYKAIQFVVTNFRTLSTASGVETRRRVHYTINIHTYPRKYTYTTIIVLIIFLHIIYNVLLFRKHPISAVQSGSTLVAHCKTTTIKLHHIARDRLNLSPHYKIYLSHL